MSSVAAFCLLRLLQIRRSIHCEIIRRFSKEKCVFSHCIIEKNYPNNKKKQYDFNQFETK